MPDEDDPFARDEGVEEYDDRMGLWSTRMQMRMLRA